MTITNQSFALDDRPSPGVATFVGLQHFLAAFGGLVTAPLLIALGMGLSLEDSTYLISAALVVSGFGTLIQVIRLGPLGSGLLSVQGTSFAFIGPILFLYGNAIEQNPPEQVLGMIFGACAICSILTMVLSQFIQRLRQVITPNVTGATVLLLGLTLVWATLNNLQREYLSAGEAGWQVWLLASTVFVVIIVVVRFGSTFWRISSIVIGLVAGFLLALALGAVDYSPLSEIQVTFLPEIGRYPLALDLTMILVLMPIFVISATESIGDLTATAELSSVKLGDDSFWKRIQGGVLAGAVSSLVAAFLSTFPSTTFSQNNGVIRITRVCSRYIGIFVAAFLILVGLVPVVGSVFQVLPSAVLYGATLLMFIMVGVSGYFIVKSASPTGRDWGLTAIAVITGLMLSVIAPKMSFLPETVVSVMSFPVSSGAFVAMLLELLIPNRQGKQGADK
ncbi:MAG: solute carrier family 23 protein [Pseudomonadota bacterium]